MGEDFTEKYIKSTGKLKGRHGVMTKKGWDKIIKEFMEMEKKEKLEKLKKTAKKIGKGGLKMSSVGLLADIGSKIGMKSKAVKDLISPEPKTYKRGGIVKRYRGGLMVAPKRAKRGY